MKAKLQQLTSEIRNKASDKQLYTIGGVLCAGVVAFATYKLIFPGQKRSSVKTPIEEEKSFEQTYKDVIKAVQEYITKYQALNGQVIKCILKNQYKLAQSQYKAFVLKVRNQRRKVMKDKNEYRRVILSVDAANEQLMDRNLNAILAHFNIQKTHWIENVEMWSLDSEQNKEEWENLLIELDNQLLDSLRDKKKSALSLKKLEDIFKFKIYTFNHLHESGLDFQSSTTSASDDEPDPNSKYLLIDKYIQDLVFNKYGVEEEDILYSQNQLSKEDQDKVYTLEDEFNDLIRIAIYGDDEEQGQENKQEQYSADGRGRDQDAESQQRGEVGEEYDQQQSQQRKSSDENVELQQNNVVEVQNAPQLEQKDQLTNVINEIANGTHEEPKQQPVNEQVQLQEEVKVDQAANIPIQGQ